MNHTDRISRRRFLTRSGSVAAAGVALPTLLPAGVLAAADRPGANERIGVGYIGVGRRGNQLMGIPKEGRIVAVADLDAGRAESTAAKRKSRAYLDYRKLLEAKDIDAVAIFSGAPDHAKHVRMCMERGWHAVSACPTCVSLEEAAMLKEIKEKTGLKYMMAESSYYRPECILARNMFREGAFGELFYTECEYYHDVTNNYYDKGDLKKPLEFPRRYYNKGWPDAIRKPGYSWRWGVAPMNYPTHSLGYLVGVTGERIAKVSCLGWRGTPELKEHPSRKDNIYNNPFWSQASMMLTDKGHMCRCNVFWICQARGERAQWFGNNGTLYMPNAGVHGAVEKIRGKGAAPVSVPQYWKSDMLPEQMRHASGHGGSAVFISAEFVNALLEDREPAIDLYESLAMTVPGIVGQQSSLKDGQQLAVPQFERPGA